MSITHKRGLPRSLEEAEELQERLEYEGEAQSPEEFAIQMFGQADKPQEGLPELDYIKDRFKTKSAAIRYLVSLGHSVKTISKHLGVKYQHVRNVALNPLKRGPNESWEPNSNPLSGTPWLPPNSVTKKNSNT